MGNVIGNMPKFKLLRKYIKPKEHDNETKTILTQVIVGQDKISVDLTPDEQSMILRMISQALLFNRPNIINANFDLESFIAVRDLYMKLEREIEKVGVVEQDLPGEPYEQ